MLCTNVFQTLWPGPLPDDDLDVRPVSTEESILARQNRLVVKATGPRGPEAYWRVHKVGQRVRRFESLSWPGHYLRLIDHACDVMVRFIISVSSAYSF
ncbi:unnamed protein product [Protopolystoma xenopodis]|uniref:Uncharacterized protein n=1 Tax=Protopolystoma xenopodis TaxID=117903 RepID=A0A3S5CLK7_9PLAT|nr:unnamed protein product [Protopolystoma xenopodis]